MNTSECPGCGNILRDDEEFCKYCGGANPNFVRKGFFTAPVTTSSQQSPTSSSEKKSFSVGIFILLFIFFWPGAIIYAIVSASNSGRKS